MPRGLNFYNLFMVTDSVRDYVKVSKGFLKGKLEEVKKKERCERQIMVLKDEGKEKTVS